MSSKNPSNSRPRSTTKTLYTPVFYTSQSSASGSTSPTNIPEAYLDYLSKKHIALAQIVEEVPSSRCGSPVDGEEDSGHSVSKARTDALRRRVQEAFKYANGDPADGKWSLLVHLLQLNTTRRKRWLGTTTAGKQAESSAGWINARSEKEWEDWDGRWRQEMFLKRKVQSWQQKVDKDLTVEPAPIVSITEDPPAIGVTDKGASTQGEVLKSKRATIVQNISGRGSNPPLGFPVIKRSSLTVIGKPKPSEKNALASNPVAGSSKILPGPSLRDIRDPDPLIGSSSPAANPQKQSIEDVSEISFFPPSFPSQLQTSTPNAKTDKRRKPEPIILAPPSSPLSTPPSSRVYGRQHPKPDTSSSLPGPFSTPTKHHKPDSIASSKQIHEKRPRSITPQRAVKKARTEPPLPSSDGCLPPSTPPPPRSVAAPITPLVTPQRALPTLTELLASSKKGKFSPRGKARKPISHANASDTPAPPPPALMLPEPVPQPVREPEPAPDAEAEHETEAHDPVPPTIFDLPDSNIYNKLSYDMGLGPGMALDYDMASPTKSLSSLAASDSEDEDDGGMDVDLGGFEPPFASTQAGCGKSGSGLGWMGYNSQFDVNGKVDIVSKFMEQDVDYDGWLKDPSVEEDGIPSQ